MKVIIIGCGNIGSKRASAILKFPEDRIVGLVEVDRSRWPALEEMFQCPVTDNPIPLIESRDLGAVIISTPPQSHIALIEGCLRNGKDVLCEKPLGDTRKEVRRVTALANSQKKILKCGFNLRHDRGLERAHALFQEGFVGRPYFIKADYVNGAVRSNTNGVGSLADMGSHLLDLCRWFVGNLSDFQPLLQQKEFPLDDNGFVQFRGPNGISGQIHFSLTRWKNDFRFEISGDQGAIEVVNLPKWGRQEVHLYKRVYPSGVPETKTEVYEGERSWEREWALFRQLCEERDLSHNEDALKIAEWMEAINP